jgi:hypothetical protein
MQHGMVFPDGPAQTFAATMGNQYVLLTHDGAFDSARAAAIGPQASPSRADVEAFMTMWSRVLAAADDLAPERLERMHPALKPIDVSPIAPTATSRTAAP